MLNRTKEQKKRIKQLLAAMAPVTGERRVIYQCGDCKALFGRRFIPYGLGHGLSVGLCTCQLTARRPTREFYRART